jgi:uncharacterized membrane protein
MSVSEPFHPAVVHFPIVLILLGTLLAVISFFRSEWIPPYLTASILSLGALGTVAATWTGDEDEERAERALQRAEQVLDEHEEWGERSRNLAILGALAAVAAAVSQKRSARIFRSTKALTAVISLGASWFVLEAGHYGGQLVYRYGVGVSENGQADSLKTDVRNKSRQSDED